MNRPLKLSLVISALLICQMTLANILPYYDKVNFLISVPKQTKMEYKFIGQTEGWEFDKLHSGCGDDFCHFTLLNKGGNEYMVEVTLIHRTYRCIANISGSVRTSPILTVKDCSGGHRITNSGKPLSYTDGGHEVDNSTLKRGSSGDYQFELSR